MLVHLLESTEIAPEVRHFRFEVAGVPEFGFRAGQFVTLRAELEGKTVVRAYSLASAPDGNRFDLCLNRVQEGAFSPYLFDLSAGQEVEMRGPFGRFVLQEPPADSLMIATGTGIAPFRGMLRARLPVDRAHHYTLIFGVRYPHGLLYREEFEELAREYTHFRFLPTVTRPDSTWSGLRGRVQPHLLEALAREQPRHIYICGLKEMVEEVRRLLAEHGVEKERVFHERFD
ncbi:MAG TPA: FAD-dependent oxidoreductase [Bryobacteraceae bacterium]|nr:FAD-dependent oxidoreductase [Bryobacteraceae bacterium]